jgi:hypothetical protein
MTREKLAKLEDKSHRRRFGGDMSGYERILGQANGREALLE